MSYVDRLYRESGVPVRVWKRCCHVLKLMSNQQVLTTERPAAILAVEVNGTYTRKIFTIRNLLGFTPKLGK